MAVVVYTKKADPYSVRMKEFLIRKRLDFEERDVAEHADELAAFSPHLAAPQLVINDILVGDYERVTSLDLRGLFDELLNQ